MIKKGLILLLTLSFFPLKGEEAIEVVKELIETTEKRLEAEKSLLHNLERFYEARTRFVEESTNAQLGGALVRAAMRVHKELEREQLAHLFSAEFLEEIRFFNQMGERTARARS